ncbi:MAG: leucine-rich repeat domain-containing protein [Clostridiales bacterium]|jgi:hypothetical protein|nr:leucine-rich repeat domain-containing protein [Clostridiales bacterium]
MSKRILVKFTVSNEGILKECDIGYTRRLRSLTVPESVVCIGKNSMCGLICNELIMPSTLKAIEQYAFKDAEIDHIDFKKCKLESIENGAFRDCTTRTELPDTVEYIGSGCEFKLAKGKKIRLPKSLKYISMSSIKLDGIREVEVQEGMVRLDSNLARWLDHRLAFKKWIILRVFRDGEELYRFIYNERWHLCQGQHLELAPGRGKRH